MAEKYTDEYLASLIIGGTGFTSNADEKEVLEAKKLLHLFIKKTKDNIISLEEIKKLPFKPDKPLIEVLSMTAELFMQLREEYTTTRALFEQYWIRNRDQTSSVYKLLTEDQWKADREAFEDLILEESIDRHRIPNFGNAVKPKINAKSLTYISKTNSVAWVFILADKNGGEVLSIDKIKRSIRMTEISNGIDFNKLEIYRPDVASRKYYLCEIALETPSRKGKNGYVKDLFPKVVKQEETIASENGTDFLKAYINRKYIASVKKGDPICELVPPEEGVPGVDVRGNAIPALPGDEGRLYNTNTVVLSEDKQKLVASVDGHLYCKGDKFYVEPFLFYHDTINQGDQLHFDCDVEITVDIPPNTLISSDGAILISGTIEGAIIEAGGDLVISEGVAGDSQAVLRTGGSLYAKYIENCIIYAVEDLNADCLINSTIFCDGNVYAVTGAGAIIGGEITVGKSLRAKSIGNKANPPTEIVAGVFTLKNEKVEELKKELTEVSDDLAEVENVIDKLDNKQLNPEGVALLAKSKLKKSVLGLKCNNLDKEIEKIMTEINLNNDPKVHAKKAYAKVAVTINGSRISLTEEHEPCSIHYRNGKSQLYYAKDRKSDLL